MRRCAVSKTVRTDVRRVRNQRDPGMHHSTNSTLVEAPAPGAKEEGRPAVGGRQRRSASHVPPFDSLHSRDAEGNGPLLVALAEHPDDVAGVVNVVNVEADQFANPDARGVQKLEDRVVAQLFWVDPASRCFDRAFKQGDSLGLRKDTRQQPLGLRSRQDQTRIRCEPATPSTERGEDSGGRGMPGDRRSRLAGGGQLGQPAAQDPDVEIGHAWSAHPVCMVEQTPDVGGVCPNRVLGQSALEPEVLDEGSKDVGCIGWLGVHSERGVFVDLHPRTHVCTVAGHSRTVKHREPDAPKVAA